MKQTISNQFSGFPKSFYDTIPYYEDSYRVAPEFEDMAERLSEYSNIDDVYKQCGLPDNERIYDLVMKDPGLLFYVNEILALPFSDADLLAQCLDHPEIYHLLADIHIMPGIAQFLSCFAQEQGEEAVFQYLQSKHLFGHLLPEAAGQFMLLSEEHKHQMFHLEEIFPDAKAYIQGTDKKWSQINRAKEIMRMPRFSYPLERYTGEMDQCIGKYRFKRLTTLHEYRKVFNEVSADPYEVCCQTLMATLPSLDEKYVVGISLEQMYVAAFKVRNNKICKLLISCHLPPDSDELYNAIEEFAKETGLVFDYMELQMIGVDKREKR